ncbi:T9SS type A sorting domain-containing protein [Hanstruepera ponticola]|uniref:T9SS type A sorting domain-containing protein n=1 Tax=Hanstruepera ponticola TaxID=2042995 RepID=UPI00178300E5|nr:T9SS type A sorting domain-containing protein [Hanstruepera ponticola]
MKRLLLPLFFILTTLVNAQIVNIPDPVFKAALLSASPSNQIAQDSSGNFYKIDANDDGEIQVTEALETTYLNISSVGLDSISGIEAFTNLQHLTSNGNLENIWDLSELINLETLNLDENPVAFLDISNSSNLISFSAFLSGITDLDVSQNPNLESLNCQTCDLTELDISNNINLISLNCSNNYYLTSLDVSQNLNLEELILTGCGLTELDVTNNENLRVLNCEANSLSELDVSNNVLLESLNCSHNDNWGYGISTIDVSQNINLQLLECSNFYLENLYIKNGINETIILEGQSYVLFICADDYDIPALEASPFIQSASVITSYCNFNPGSNNNVISGNIFLDTENNGCTTSDLPALNFRLDINDGTNQGMTFANNSGEYVFYTQSGNFELLPSIENPTWFDISPTSANIEFTDNNFNTAIQDFCVTPVGVHNDVEIIISPIVPAQPGFDATYQLAYRNKGNQTLSGEINFEYNEALLDFITASISPDSQGSGVLSWNYANLPPFQSRTFTVTLNVNAPTETPAVNIGDELPFISAINPTVGDEIPSDNTFQFKQIVIGSYDPNDKTCLEGDIVESNQIGEYLHFNINFENTGTAAATFVVVKDVINETMFDMNTLQVMYASHEMMTQVAGNKIEFIFDNINLGTEEKGNVVFKIKTLDTLNVGDSVTNDAEIFFDYNFPIVTNETNTTFQTLSVEENQLGDAITVYPNPTSGLLHINTRSVIQKVEIYDVQGRLVVSQNSNQNKQTLNTSALTKGVYFVKIKTKNGQQIVNIIKE